MDHPTALAVLTDSLRETPTQAWGLTVGFWVLSEPEGKLQASSPIYDLQVTHQAPLFTCTPWKPTSEKLDYLASQSHVCFLSEKAHSLVLPNARHESLETSKYAVLYRHNTYIGMF